MNRAYKKLTYLKSGVNIKKADGLIGKLQKSYKKNYPNVISGIGGFASLYTINLKKYSQPAIVCGTDGIGTKLKIAKLLNQHNYIGQDLVAMCVNDIITCGADPLFFLDYLATGKLDLKFHINILKGIKKACSSIDIPLIGGETAEMPGMYKQKDYDLAGFCVGIIDKKNIINKNEINKGDIIIGLMSNGIHSNGYSLINKLLDNKTLSLRNNYFGVNLGRLLIKPTLLYVDALNKIKKTISIKGAANITGGGITENLPRVIPKKYTISINLDNWKMPNIFRLIKEHAKLSMDEMLRTFNCGIGMAIIVKKSDASKVIKILEKTKFKAKIIGQINNKYSNKIIKYEKG